MPQETAAFTALHEAIAAIPLVDTHEHLPDESTLTGRSWSFFDFFEHYVSSDLVSAGMSREALEKMRNPSSGLSLEERWGLMAPYWPFVKTTGYGQAMTAYMADLFGIGDINERTYAELSRRINEARKPGWYRTVLKDKANIECSLVITWPGQPVAVDKAFFRAVPILDHYAIPGTRAELGQLEKESARSIQTLDQLLAAQEAALDAFFKQGIAAVKIFLAYRRTLRFDRVSKAEAARAFDRIWLSQSQDLAFEDLKPLQDFMTRTLIDVPRTQPAHSDPHRVAGNGNYIATATPRCSPTSSWNTRTRGLTFSTRDIRLRASWPRWRSISPTSCRLVLGPGHFPSCFQRTLHEWLDTIPANKIFAAGGDSNYVEGAYGHCAIARRLVAEVLAERMAQGTLDQARAMWLAGRLLRENAKAFFRL